MYVYMYVCMYVSMYVCMYVSMYICIYVCTLYVCMSCFILGNDYTGVHGTR